MSIFKTGDGTEETVLFVTLSMVTPSWFRVAFMGAIREMTVQSNWFVEGDATADFARDKAVEMINSIEFSGENPLPIWKMPIGGIAMFPDDNIPIGWLACHGQTLLIADYPDLYAVIGTRFGASGGTGFLLPNMKQRFPVGAEHLVSGYEIGDTGGARDVTLTTAQIPAHAHTGVVSPNNPVSNRAVVSSGGVQTVRTAGTSDNEGGGGSHENRPPYLAFEFMIYTGVE